MFIDVLGLITCTTRKSFGHHHHANELFEIDLSIAVHVCFPDHVIDLVISKFLTEVGHDQLQFCG